MKNGFKECLLGFKHQVSEAIELGKEISFDSVNKVLICGMGGSALPGDLLNSLFYPLNFELVINKDYIIPEFINENYLCFCISYSGNTEETIQMYKDLVKKTSKIVVITSGGEIENLSMKNKTAMIRVPKGFPPRMATAYMTLPIINVLVNSNIINYNLRLEIAKASPFLDYAYERKAKLLARKLKGVTPLIYTSKMNEITALKWKIAFNENAKTPAFCNVFPEWNHNELNGFNNTKTKFAAVMLTDKLDDERVKKRFRVTSRLLKKKGLRVLPVPLEGDSRLSKILFGILFGDWVSYELALLYNEDALNVPIIEVLKKDLRK
ncbi:MAG: bifunctional phosphoglucose/phosphomannose isomerase [Nanoarchaeota archaeon]|nr:bifunctional phosphoglucose/phosphomannose isomerase [Nanoarchaeota archaeon]